MLDSPAMGRIQVKRIAWTLIVGAFAAVAVAACGGSGGSSHQAQSVLREAFKNRPINSGNLSVKLAVTPSGSQTFKTPIQLSFGGPFEALGKGQAPKSNFTISLSALGKSGSLGVISTGTKGYVTLRGTSYQLPQSTFKKFESSLAPVTNSTGSSLFGKLPKIDFISWIRNPVVEGNETVEGANTTHVHGQVDVSKMLTDLNSVAHSAPSVLGSGISSGSVTSVASKVRNPTLDVWAGVNDHILRKLAVTFGVPVSGSISTLFGGVRTAQVSLVVQYADINQPQTIAAPSSAKPFNQFVSQMRSFIGGLEGSLGGTTSSTGSGSSTGSTASSGKLQRYSNCIQSAGNDVTKMQRCASILNK